MVVPTSSGLTERQITLMKDFGATALFCTPSYALTIAERAAELKVDLRALPLRVGVFGAEPWSTAMRQEIEERMGIKAHEAYGLTELGGPGVGFDCVAQDGIHINEDHFLAEIVDPQTLELLPLGEKGELVFTSLQRRAMPMLRYRTKDITRLRREKCACGRTFIKMDKIFGRSDDMLIISGVNVFPSQIESLLLEIPEVEPQYRLVVRKKGYLDQLIVQVEGKKEIYDAGPEKRLEVAAKVMWPHQGQHGHRRRCRNRRGRNSSTAARARPCGWSTSAPSSCGNRPARSSGSGSVRVLLDKPRPRSPCVEVVPMKEPVRSFNPSRFAVVGAGPVGCIVAAFLAGAGLRGHPVRRGARRSWPRRWTRASRLEGAENFQQKVTRTCLAIDDLAGIRPRGDLHHRQGECPAADRLGPRGLLQRGHVRRSAGRTASTRSSNSPRPSAEEPGHARRGQLRMRPGGAAATCGCRSITPRITSRSSTRKSKGATVAIAAALSRCGLTTERHGPDHLHGLAQGGAERLHEPRVRGDGPHHEPRHERPHRLPDRERPGQGVHPGRAGERDQPGLGLLPQRHRVHGQGRRPQALDADGRRGRPPHRGGLHQRQVRRVRAAGRGGHARSTGPCSALVKGLESGIESKKTH
ncbi:MAG: AMP-binding protein [Desulfobacterales bacterium]|nr:AMP-binding protein [Desulfobacterales bacterium]